SSPVLTSVRASPSVCTLSRRSLHSFPTRRSSDLFPDPQIHIVVPAVRHGGVKVRCRFFRLSKFKVHRSAAEIYVRIFLQLQHIRDRKSTRLNSSHVSISHAVSCLRKKTRHIDAAP